MKGEFRARKGAGPLLVPTEEEPVFGTLSQDPASVGQPWVQVSIGVTVFRTWFSLESWSQRLRKR